MSGDPLWLAALGLVAGSVIAAMIVAFTRKSKIVPAEPEQPEQVKVAAEPAPANDPIKTPNDPVKGFVGLPARQFSAFKFATQRGMHYCAEFDARVSLVGSGDLESVDWPKHGPVVLTLSGKSTPTIAAVLLDAGFEPEGDEWVWRSPVRRDLHAVEVP